MAYGVERHDSRRVIGIGAVLLLHVALVYALANGLTSAAIQKVNTIFETKIIEAPKDVDKAPPPPPPAKIKPPPPYVPPPEINITMPTETAPTNAIRAVTNTNATPPKQNKRRPNPQPEYPAASRRAGEEGVVELLLYVDADGRVTKAEVKKSSGFPLLDEAAVNGAMRWRFTPGTKNGEPAEGLLIAPVKFSLKNAR